MRPGEVASAAGVHLETLRYYERRGLLDEPDRSQGGVRLYPAETVSRLRFIKSAQRLGFTLAEIADLLRSCWERTGPPAAAAVRARASAKAAELEQLISNLSAIRDALRFGSAGRCADPIAYLASGSLHLPTPAVAGMAPSSGERENGMSTISPDHPLATALVAAIHAGDIERLRQLLTENPGLATVRIGDNDPAGRSRTPLHVVTDWPGHFPHGASAVAVLVEAGAEVNARFHGPHRETPLHWAASSDDVSVLDALIDAGADLEADGAVLGGGTALADARGFAQWRAAFRLVERGAETTVVDEATLGLMDRLIARFDGPDSPPSERIDHAFWGACHGGRQDAAEFLLTRGANRNWLPPWENLTPLDAAVRQGAHELATWLRAHGGVSAGNLR